jgi:addiction module HigA family antidote
MSAVDNTYSPDYAVHPGEYLDEVLESRGIAKKEFADRCGLSPKTISQIVNGKAFFSPDVALQFERVLGVAAEIWLCMLSSSQLFQSRTEDEKRLQKAREWTQKFPLSDMRKHGLIESTTDWALTARQILSFFNVSSPDSWEKFYREKAIAYRKSPTLEASDYSVATWLRIAEKVAVTRQVQLYQEDRLKTVINRIRTLTSETPEIFEPKIRAECSEAGITLVFVPELQMTRISGATEWLTSDNAMIAMSLRHKTNDHFWFTLFHEIGHIYLHGKKMVFIDAESDEETERESEANDFARRTLVPTKEYQRFVARAKFYAPDILEFSTHIGIAPGIVVGILQHDGLIQYSWHNGLKQKFQLVPASTRKDRE